MKVVVGAAVTVALTVASIVVNFGTAAPVADSGGMMVFLAKGCTGCHTLNEARGGLHIGPDLTFVDVVAGSRVEGLSAEEYIRQSVTEPRAFVVPGFEPLMPTLDLTDDEVAVLVELLLQPD